MATGCRWSTSSGWATTPWDAMIAGGTDFPKDAAQPDDVANIQYTSGTTGSPKGAMLTHRNLLNNGMAMGLGLKATEKDRICAPVPLYHCFGSVIGSMVSVVSGAALILPSAQFDALATLEAVHRERATALYGVPTMFIAEMEHPEFARFDLTSLRTGVMAGRAVSHRADEARGGAHARARDHHCVRTDGVVAGNHHVAGGRSPGAARDHRGDRAAQYGNPDRRPENPPPAAHRPAGRAVRRAVTW